MCSLCGVLGGQGHWADPASNPEAFEDRGETHTWHRERQQRARLTNRILKYYGLKVSDWSGHAFILRSMTGQTAIVDNLAELWPAAERLSGRVCDPLNPELLRLLAQDAAQDAAP
jgi:hypothetical protein